MQTVKEQLQLDVVMLEGAIEKLENALRLLKDRHVDVEYLLSEYSVLEAENEPNTF